jgi:hypothetical protein
LAVTKLCLATKSCEVWLNQLEAAYVRHKGTVIALCRAKWYVDVEVLDVTWHAVDYRGFLRA